MKPLVVLGFCALGIWALPVAAAETVQPVAPAVTEGTWKGVVTEKGENWIRVKAGDGKTERFMPQWIGGMPPGGGLDKGMVEKLKQVRVGAEVEVKWVWSERMRVVGLSVVKEPAERR